MKKSVAGGVARDCLQPVILFRCRQSTERDQEPLLDNEDFDPHLLQRSKDPVDLASEDLVHGCTKPAFPRNRAEEQQGGDDDTLFHSRMAPLVVCGGQKDDRHADQKAYKNGLAQHGVRPILVSCKVVAEYAAKQQNLFTGHRQHSHVLHHREVSQGHRPQETE